jgi:hypothetical protein
MGSRGNTDLAADLVFAGQRHCLAAENATGAGTVPGVSLVVEGVPRLAAPEPIITVLKLHPGRLARAEAEGRVPGEAGVEVGDADVTPVDRRVSLHFGR